MGFAISLRGETPSLVLKKGVAFTPPGQIDVRKATYVIIDDSQPGFFLAIRTSVTSEPDAAGSFDLSHEGLIYESWNSLLVPIDVAASGEEEVPPEILHRILFTRKRWADFSIPEKASTVEQAIFHEVEHLANESLQRTMVVGKVETSVLRPWQRMGAKIPLEGKQVLPLAACLRSRGLSLIWEGDSPPCEATLRENETYLFYEISEKHWERRGNEWKVDIELPSDITGVVLSINDQDIFIEILPSLSVVGISNRPLSLRLFDLFWSTVDDEKVIDPLTRVAASYPADFIIMREARALRSTADITGFLLTAGCCVAGISEQMRLEYFQTVQAMLDMGGAGKRPGSSCWSACFERLQAWLSGGAESWWLYRNTLYPVYDEQLAAAEESVAGLYATATDDLMEVMAMTVLTDLTIAFKKAAVWEKCLAWLTDLCGAFQIQPATILSRVLTPEGHSSYYGDDDYGVHDFLSEGQGEGAQEELLADWTIECTVDQFYGIFDVSPLAPANFKTYLESLTHNPSGETFCYNVLCLEKGVSADDERISLLFPEGPKAVPARPYCLNLHRELASRCDGLLVGIAKSVDRLSLQEIFSLLGDKNDSSPRPEYVAPIDWFEYRFLPGISLADAS